MKMNILTKKVTITSGVFCLAGFLSAQSLEEGIVNIDSHKYAKAKQIFTQMIQTNPKEASNYFYLGNSYLSQLDPDYDEAKKYFDQGLSVDSKHYLNKIGLASIKIAKGDKSGISEVQSIVSESKEKDAEVLYRAAEALTMFQKNNAPDLAIDYLNKAIEKSKKGVPSNYYYSLGDAYRLKKKPGDAMTSYEKALSVATNKASVFTRMATLWMAAQKWQLAKENIDKAITVDPTYAPAYKAKAEYDYKYQENAKVTQSLINYAKYADEDPYTQLEIAKLYFINEDYSNAKTVLNSVFDKVNDPIKYKLRAYLEYGGDKNYASAKQNLEKFFSEVKDQSRVYPSDKGLEGLILVALAKDETDEAKKSQLLADSKKYIQMAKDAKDTTYNWDQELEKVSGGGASLAEAEAGPTNSKVEELKSKVKANPEDLNSLVQLGVAYQEVKNWHGAILTWDKVIALSPAWAYSYYAKGSAYQALANHDMAEKIYEVFIEKVNASTPQEQEQNKEALSYAYYLVAYYNQQKDKAKSLNYAQKSVQLNPNYSEATKLLEQLSK